MKKSLLSRPHIAKNRPAKMINEPHSTCISLSPFFALHQMNNESIYDGKRLAQPDELANCSRGDGIEKAFLLANLIHDRNPEQNIEMIIDKKNVLIKTTSKEYRFISAKEIQKSLQIT